MVLEQGALTGRYNETHPFPAGTGRGDAYNPHLKELSALIEELSVIGTRFNASPRAGRNSMGHFQRGAPDYRRDEGKAGRGRQRKRRRSH